VLVRSSYLYWIPLYCNIERATSSSIHNSLTKNILRLIRVEISFISISTNTQGFAESSSGGHITYTDSVGIDETKTHVLSGWNFVYKSYYIISIWILRRNELFTLNRCESWALYIILYRRGKPCIVNFSWIKHIVTSSGRNRRFRERRVSAIQVFNLTYSRHIG
jgi:hypothetical protein